MRYFGTDENSTLFLPFPPSTTIYRAVHFKWFSGKLIDHYKHFHNCRDSFCYTVTVCKAC